MNSIYASNCICQLIWPDFTAHFRSHTTAASYQADIVEIMEYFQKDFLEIREEEVKEYFEILSHKVEQENLKPGTMAKKFRELHSFAEYVCENCQRYGVDEGYRDYYYPYLKQVAKQEKFAKAVPVRQIDELLKVAEDNLMEYCILVMLFRAGLSSTELSNLQVEDLAIYENGTYAQIRGRKNLCFIPEDACDVLEEYLEERSKNSKMAHHPYLFCNQRGNQLNPMYISRMMRKYEEKAGLPHYSAQSVRNSCAVTLFVYGASQEQVASQMGTTKLQIKRYRNLVYQEQLQQQANDLVKLKVEPPGMR